MGKKETLLKELKKFKKDLSHDLPVQRMILFGSQAKGETRQWSDVDLLVVSNKFKKIKPYQRARGFYDHWTIGKPVDFLCYTPEEFNKLKKSLTLIKEIVKEGIEIY
ncbi:nucleotidyltransferase domain-containing protein [Candidatus Woesearchaeota archaeon]|nr:nucleotidyltransferase domain-containing protein [Candidatus Woesearchaeota archaeon]